MWRELTTFALFTTLTEEVRVMVLDIIACTLAIELALAWFAAAQPNHRWVPQRKVRLQLR